MKEMLKCGECGCETHTLKLVREEYEPRFGGGPTGNSIETTCTQCKTVSLICISYKVPKFTVEHSEYQINPKSTGCLCGGWAEKRPKEGDRVECIIGTPNDHWNPRPLGLLGTIINPGSDYWIVQGDNGRTYRTAADVWKLKEDNHDD